MLVVLLSSPNIRILEHVIYCLYELSQLPENVSYIIDVGGVTGLLTPLSLPMVAKLSSGVLLAALKSLNILSKEKKTCDIISASGKIFFLGNDIMVTVLKFSRKWIWDASSVAIGYY